MKQLNPYETHNTHTHTNALPFTHSFSLSLSLKHYLSLFHTRTLLTEKVVCTESEECIRWIEVQCQYRERHRNYLKGKVLKLGACTDEVVKM